MAGLGGLLGGLDPSDYGTWAFYPWRGRLVHLLPCDEFRFVRTDRNRDKITREEQVVLGSAALTAPMEGVGALGIHRVRAGHTMMGGVMTGAGPGAGGDPAGAVPHAGPLARRHDLLGRRAPLARAGATAGARGHARSGAQPKLMPGSSGSEMLGSGNGRGIVIPGLPGACGVEVAGFDAGGVPVPGRTDCVGWTDGAAEPV